MKYFSLLITCFFIVFSVYNLNAQTIKTIETLSIAIKEYQFMIGNPNLNSTEKQKAINLYQIAKQEIEALGGSYNLSWDVPSDRQEYITKIIDLVTSNLDVNSISFQLSIKAITKTKPQLTFQEEQMLASRDLSEREYHLWKIFYSKYKNFL